MPRIASDGYLRALRLVRPPFDVRLPAARSAVSTGGPGLSASARVEEVQSASRAFSGSTDITATKGQVPEDKTDGVTGAAATTNGLPPPFPPPPTRPPVMPRHARRQLSSAAARFKKRALAASYSASGPALVTPGPHSTTGPGSFPVLAPSALAGPSFSRPLPPAPPARPWKTPLPEQTPLEQQQEKENARARFTMLKRAFDLIALPVETSTSPFRIRRSKARPHRTPITMSVAQLLAVPINTTTQKRLLAVAKMEEHRPELRTRLTLRNGYSPWVASRMVVRAARGLERSTDPAGNSPMPLLLLANRVGDAFLKDPRLDPETLQAGWAPPASQSIREPEDEIIEGNSTETRSDTIGTVPEASASIPPSLPPPPKSPANETFWVRCNEPWAIRFVALQVFSRALNQVRLMPSDGPRADDPQRASKSGETTRVSLADIFFPNGLPAKRPDLVQLGNLQLTLRPGTNLDRARSQFAWGASVLQNIAVRRGPVKRAKPGRLSVHWLDFIFTYDKLAQLGISWASPDGDGVNELILSPVSMPSISGVPWTKFAVHPDQTLMRASRIRGRASRDMPDGELAGKTGLYAEPKPKQPIVHYIGKPPIRPPPRLGRLAPIVRPGPVPVSATAARVESDASRDPEAESGWDREALADELERMALLTGFARKRKKPGVRYVGAQVFDGPRLPWSPKEGGKGLVPQAMAAMSTQARQAPIIAEVEEDAAGDEPIPAEAIAAAQEVPEDLQSVPPAMEDVGEATESESSPDPRVVDDALSEVQSSETDAEVERLETRRKLPSSLDDIEDVEENVPLPLDFEDNPKVISKGYLHARDVVLEEVAPIHPGKVARLRPGLTRALFRQVCKCSSPGVHFLQDPRTGVYNFSPDALQCPPKPDEYAFERGPTFIPPSKDLDLRDMAEKYRVRFRGSTSSLTKILSHLYMAISGFRDPDTSSLSQVFASEPKSLTLGAMLPAMVILRKTDGLWAVDSDKKYDSPSVLSQYGHIMERMLTSQTAEEFKRFLKSSNDAPRDEGYEAYMYQRSGSLLMRSQLDCYDPRLPGHGTFDIKTRAVFPLRHDRANWIENSKYEIATMQGYEESFEREYYDMIRATLLKYSFQARIGKMDGIFLAYHNTAKIFGFEYLPMSKIDEIMFGSTELADQAFKLCVGLTEIILKEVTDCATSMDDAVSEIGVVMRTKASTGVRSAKYTIDIWVQPKLRPQVAQVLQQTGSASRPTPDAAQSKGGKTTQGKPSKPVPAPSTPSRQAEPEPVVQAIQLTVESYLDGEKHVGPMAFSSWPEVRADQAWSVKYSIDRLGLNARSQAAARSTRQAALKDLVSLMKLAVPDGATVQEMTELDAKQGTESGSALNLWAPPTKRVMGIRRDAQASGARAEMRRKLWKAPVGGPEVLGWEAVE